MPRTSVVRKRRAARARKCRSTSARASELLPTWKSVPSGRRTEATSKTASGPGTCVNPGSETSPGGTRLRRSSPRQDEGRLPKRASAPGPSTRTKSPSFRPATRSLPTASWSAGRPPRRYCSDVLLERSEHELAVALGEGGGEEGVGEEHEREAARHEQPRVPEAEAEAEGPAGAARPPQEPRRTYPMPRTVCSIFGSKSRSIRSRSRWTSTSTTFVPGSKA